MSVLQERQRRDTAHQRSVSTSGDRQTGWRDERSNVLKIGLTVADLLQLHLELHILLRKLISEAPLLIQLLLQLLELPVQRCHAGGWPPASPVDGRVPSSEYQGTMMRHMVDAAPRQSSDLIVREKPTREATPRRGPSQLAHDGHTKWYHVSVLCFNKQAKARKHEGTHPT